MDWLWITLAIIGLVVIVLLLVLALKATKKDDRKYDEPSSDWFPAWSVYRNRDEYENWGEHKIAQLLEQCKIDGDKIINDVIIENPETGKTSEIDHILFSTRGIFVIETKDVSGDVYGDDSLNQWKQYLADGTVTHKLYSPVKQNNTHIYVLKKILKTKVWLENIVVFVQGNTYFIQSEFVYTPQQLQTYLNEKTTYPVSERERDKLYNIVLRYKETPVATKSQHIQNVHTMQQRIEANLCPLCSGELRFTYNAQGAHYTCSNYPQCKFTKDID